MALRPRPRPNIMESQNELQDHRQLVFDDPDFSYSSHQDRELIPYENQPIGKSTGMGFYGENTEIIIRNRRNTNITGIGGTGFPKINDIGDSRNIITMDHIVALVFGISIGRGQLDSRHGILVDKSDLSC